MSDGALDSTFGGRGVVKTGFAGEAWPYALTVGRNGEIAAAGGTPSNGFAVARYLADGRLDRRFGEDGTALTLFGADDYSSARAVALQPDGKTVVAGLSGPSGNRKNRFALVRYTIGGIPDPSFGNGGRVLTAVPRGGEAGLFALALQPDGKIVAAGASGEDFAVARYLPDGSLDPGFRAMG